MVNTNVNDIAAVKRFESRNFRIFSTMNRYFEAYPKVEAGALTLLPPPLTEPDATWNSYNSEPAARLLGERIKPERNRNGVNVQKVQWRRSCWVDGFPELVSSMTIADVSPRFAIKRILILYENAQYREAANFINRLSHGTFKAILAQLPIDVFIEAMPHSVSILEALYGKVFLSSDLCVKILKPDTVLMRLVKLYSGNTTCVDRWLASTQKLLKVIALSEPKLRKSLMVRRRALDKAVEGLGQHGLVGTGEETLTNLHDALKVEFQKLIELYKTAVQKLDELSLSSRGKDGVSKGPAPVQASHQRQLSLRQKDIQERLIKNKTLLNVVEPALENKSLAILLTILKRRVEYDKDALFQFTQLRKELEADTDHVVAPLLMRYSHACEQVLGLMKEVLEDEDSSDISGYHSDSDSAIMMSGNSPYVSKHARHNFLSRSVRSGSNYSARTCLILSTDSSSESPPEHHSLGGANWDWTNEKSSEVEETNMCSNCGSQSSTFSSRKNRKLTSLQTELETTKIELQRTKSKIESLAKLHYHSPSPKEISAQRLVRCYGNLYSQGRVNALEALDSIPQLQGARELKFKILFSIVVLAFRSAQALLAQKKEQIEKILFNSASSNSSQIELKLAINTYLRRTVDSFDISSCIEEVCTQLWATLYDYPCLKTCSGLLQYVKDSVRLAWALTNQIPSHVLEYERRTFCAELHVRFHSSKNDSDQIRTYMWPALLEGPNGICVHKAVVLT